MTHRSITVGGAFAVAALASFVTIYAAPQRGGGAAPAAQNAVRRHAQPTDTRTCQAVDGGGGGGGGAVRPDEKGNIVQLTQARLCHQTQIDAVNVILASTPSATPA
jgi:hypothetical protein